MTGSAASHGPALGGELSLGRPLVLSAAAHLAIAAVLLLRHAAAPAPMPPTYRVNLIAAPPGARAVGVVQPPSPVRPAAAAAPARPAAAAARTVPATTGMAAPPRAARPRVPPAATPSAAASPRAAPAAPAPAAPAAAVAPPRAGGGPTGGRGTDVANVQVDGTAFPYPGYLDNVVRQIALRFRPPSGGALTAVVAFLIRRDGSVTGIRLTTRSGVYAFDTEAMGAVDAAAHAHAFGPLPQGFTDDALPVIFSFDPRLIR